MANNLKNKVTLKVRLFRRLSEVLLRRFVASPVKSVMPSTSSLCKCRIIILNNHKYSSFFYEDAKYSYKQAYGYFPGVVSIDGIIAYIENRDGNTPVKFHQADTLSRAFKLLHSYGLHIGIFRADCGSYSEDIIRTVDGNCRIFYIRAIHSASMYSRIQDIRDTIKIQILYGKTLSANLR